MKIFKYLMLVAASAFMLTSCNEKDVDVDAPWEVVNNNQAQVQIMYMSPVVSNLSNNFYKIEMAGMTYVNKGAAILAPYNAVPGGSTGLFYTVPAGDNNLKLYNSAGELMFDQNFNVPGGKKYQVVVCELNQAPIVVEMPVIPTQVTTNTAEYCAVRFYNFMWEADGVRPDYKLQVRIETITGQDADGKDIKEYLPVSHPVGFGEATEWFMPTVIKTTYNSSGSARVNLDVMKVNADGSLEELPWLNAKGVEQAKFTDYWTESIGRGYCWIMRGVRNDTFAPVAITQWTVR